MSSEYRTASEGGSGQHGYFFLETPSGDSSAEPSRPGTSGENHPTKRGRVRFNSTSEANDATNKRSSFPVRDRSLSPEAVRFPKQVKASPSSSRMNSVAPLLRHTPETEKANPFADPVLEPVFKPRPSVLSNNSSSNGPGQEDFLDYDEKAFSALAAQERAKRVASLVGSHSAPNSRRNSLDEESDDGFISPHHRSARGYPIRIDDIPLVDMDNRRSFDGGVSDEDECCTDEKGKAKVSSSSEAHKLVRAHTRKYGAEAWNVPSGSKSAMASGQVTPNEEERFAEEFVPRPQQYRSGVLSSLLKLYNAPPGSHSRRGSDSSTESVSHPGTGSGSRGSSGTTTPRSKAIKWYNHRNQSQDTLAGLVEASAILGAQGGVRNPKKKPSRSGLKKAHSGNLISSAMSKINRPRLEDEIRITVHIAETLSRQKYLLELCRALMSYGAPTHRLEEYMKMSARVLEIDGQFLYIPGCMIISFDDVSTHTTEVKLVKAPQGVDLGKLKDIHEIYKEVVHDVIGVEEATQRLDIIINAKQKYNKWLLVFVYGFASATVAPFAFEARMIDLPIAYLLGCILGFLQLIAAPKSDLYSNVFEISAAVITSFLARAFGSIRGGNLFCFSALAQSSIALILPGYMVLCGSLELQSKSMVAGSVRMVYAIIYSLFLGFGITIGTAFYGLLDADATSATTCMNPIGTYYKWIFVPPFTLCLCIINQAKWKQTPVMLVISFVGYIVNFFSAGKFSSSPQISSTLGALAVGVMGNLYSRMRHGVAAAALLPAIFVQVPSGLAASGSLLAGISSADQITNTTLYSNGTSKINGTSTVSNSGGGDGWGHPFFGYYNANNSDHVFVLPYVVSVTSATDLNTIVFNVGYSMIQVAIGITVGLFLSALIIYPLGKRRSGLFSF